MPATATVLASAMKVPRDTARMLFSSKQGGPPLSHVFNGDARRQTARGMRLPAVSAGMAAGKRRFR